MSSKYSVISLDDGNDDDDILLTTINSNDQKNKIPTTARNNSWVNVTNSNVISTVLTYLISLTTWITYLFTTSLQALFSWYNEIIAIGNNRTLLDDDLFNLPSDMEGSHTPLLMTRLLTHSLTSSFNHSGRNIYENFERLWTIEELKANKKNDVKLLWNSLHSLIFREFWFAGLCRFINDSCVIIGALLLKLIINSAENHDVVSTTMFAFLITFNSITQSIFLQQFVHGVFMAGSKVVSASTSAVFHATLSIRMHRLQPSRTLGYSLTYSLTHSLTHSFTSR